MTIHPNHAPPFTRPRALLVSLTAFALLTIGPWNCPAQDDTGTTSATGVMLCDTDWPDTQPPIPKADIFLFHASDNCGLGGTRCNEIAEYGPRLVQAWMALAGKPMTSPDLYAARAAVMRRGQLAPTESAFRDADIASLSRPTGAATAVRTELKRSPAGETTARMRALSTADGSMTGEWIGVVPEPRPSYDGLFDAQARAALKTAAALAGLPSEDALVAGIRAAAPPASELPAMEERLSEARRLIAIPTLARLTRAVRLVQPMVEKYPGFVEGWLTLAGAHSQLAFALSRDCTREWHDAMRRALTAGEIAHTLAPDSPAARCAWLLGLAAAQRNAQAARLAKSSELATPDDLLTTMVAAFVCGRRADLAGMAGKGGAREREWHGILSARIGADGDPDTAKSQITDWISASPFAPLVWERLGDAAAADSQLNIERAAYSTQAIQGALAGVVEAVRAHEDAGSSAAAADALERMRRLARADRATSAPPTVGSLVSGILGAGPEEQQSALESILAGVFAGSDAAAGKPTTADALESALQRISPSTYMEAGFQSMWWTPADLPTRLLKEAESIRAEAQAKSATPPNLATARSSHGLDTGDLLRLARRPAADGVAATIHALGIRFGIGPDGREVIDSLASLYPGDPHPPLEQQKYQVSAFPDARTGSAALVNSWQCDPFFLRMRWWQKGVITGSMSAMTDAMESVKYYAPLHTATIEMIAGRLKSIGNLKTAESYYGLMLVRDPSRHDARIGALLCKAGAEERLPTAEEIDKVAARIPQDFPRRNLLLARLHSSARDFASAADLYDTALATTETRSVEDYTAAARVNQLAGRRDRAIAVLGAYAEMDGNSLSTCVALERLAYIHQSTWELDKAMQAWKAAAKVDSWKGDVLARGAFIEWCRGNHAKAAAAFQGALERYPGGFFYYWAHTALWADGQTTEAERVLAEGLKVAPLNWQLLEAGARLCRVKGEADRGTQLLTRALNSLPNAPDYAVLLANHHHALGDTAKAVEWADRAMATPAPGGAEDCLPAAARYHLEAGDIAGADKFAKALSLLAPTGVDGEMMLARIALAQGRPDEALRLLQPALNIPQADARIIAARALLAQGRAQEAYDHAKIVVSFFVWPDPEAWLVFADAATAVGKRDEAKSILELCVSRCGPQTAAARSATEKLSKL